MAYKRYLDGSELDYVKSLEPEKMKELGYKENDKGYFQKTPTFDGKTLSDFLATDYDYYDSFENDNGRVGTRGQNEMHADAMAGVGPRADFFAPLTANGIGIPELSSLAIGANLTNVNSPEDILQLIAEDDARHTSEAELEEALSGFEPAQPEIPTAEEPEIPGYSLSDELDAAIDRNNDFQERRLAGEIFGNNLPGRVDLDSEVDSEFLYDYARGMQDRLRSYGKA